MTWTFLDDCVIDPINDECLQLPVKVFRGIFLFELCASDLYLLLLFFSVMSNVRVKVYLATIITFLASYIFHLQMNFI